MISKDIKDWSILIYANGNNELEPEISNAKKISETVGSNENVNIIMQIAREDRNLARLLRPLETFPDSDDKWIGVRKYLIGLNNSKHLETISDINMADAKNLYDFIIWAVENFPARHYMLILGGHGYQFVGCMTDYSGKIPYIMGIPELCNAIDFACKYSNIKIDLLLMDTCYSNFIEVVYELGKTPEHGVKYMLTYIINGPIAGFPYNQIISILQSNSKDDCIEHLTELLVESFTSDTVVFKIDYNELNVIKSLFSDLARVYINLDKEHKIGLSQIFSDNKIYTPYYEIVNNISNKMNNLICGYKKISKYNYPLINIANKPAKDMYIIRLYNKLAFSHNNYWTELLYNINKRLLYESNDYPNFAPVILTPKAIYTYISIMNRSQDSEYKNKIFLNLIKYKNWKI